MSESRRKSQANDARQALTEISLDVSARFAHSSLEMGKTDTALSDEIGEIEQSTAVIPIETAYLRQLKATHRARAHAAMRWRPRLLKALAMSCRLTLALKAAKVSYNTLRAHERNDPEFAAQLKEAQEEGAQLLHDVCFKAALEGELEPVYFQGQIVGHIRKYDSRMQIEMLRAYMPKVFKAPGAKVAISTGNQQNQFICGPEEMDAMIASRQAALQRMKAQRDAAALPLTPAS